MHKVKRFHRSFNLLEPLSLKSHFRWATLASWYLSASQDCKNIYWKANFSFLFELNGRSSTSQLKKRIESVLRKTGPKNLHRVHKQPRRRQLTHKAHPKSSLSSSTQRTSNSDSPRQTTQDQRKPYHVYTHNTSTRWRKTAMCRRCQALRYLKRGNSDYSPTRLPNKHPPRPWHTLKPPKQSNPRRRRFTSRHRCRATSSA